MKQIPTKAYSKKWKVISFVVCLHNPTNQHVTISLFVKISEAHLCYEKKIQTELDSASSVYIPVQ